METLVIPPLDRPLDAVVTVPGSKSITNRALPIAALADGESVITGALFSEDTHWCSEGLRRLGIPVQGDQEHGTFRVEGQGGRIPAERADLFVGNSGTTARFLTALLALGRGTYRMDGIARMRERPLADLLGVLADNGARLTYEGQPGCLPFVLQGHGMRGGAIRLRADQTSQQLSALLMAAPYAERDTVITVDGELVSRSYIEITRRVMSDFGVEMAQPDKRTFAVRAGQRYRARAHAVEPDASNASYFFAAAAVTGGRVRVEGLSLRSCQGDIQFLRVLEAMGCRIEAGDSWVGVSGPGQLRGVDVDMNDISDTVQTLAAIAPFAASAVTVRNVGHMRLKETDRLGAVATELARAGIRVEMIDAGSGLRVYPGTPRPTAIDTYNDHRMAMAFAVMGLKAPGIAINDPGCTAKTFPDFFARFFAMYGAAA